MTSMPRRARPVRNTWLLVAALVAALIIILLFAATSINTFVAGRGSVVALQPWMTVPYIARINTTPPGPLYAAIELPPNARDDRPISAIARAQQRPLGTLLASLDQAIARTQAPGMAAPTSPP